MNADVSPRQAGVGLSAEESTFSSKAPRLVRNGYEPIPIHPAQKLPVLSEWQHYRFAAGDETKWPRAGVGVLTGETIAIDIDVTDEEVAERVSDLVRQRLGASPVRIGQFPKRLHVVRTDDPFRKKQTAAFNIGSKPCRVEVLAQGQQFVAFGIHPNTRKPYTWNGAGDLCDVSIDQLPCVTEARIAALLPEIEELLAEYGERIVTVADIPDATEAGRRLHAPSLIAAVVDGADLHDSLRDLAAHYAAQGLTFKHLCELLEGIMLASAVEHDDRWKARYADIPRLVHSALEKFKAPIGNSDDALRVEHLPDGWQHKRPPGRPFILHPYIPQRAVSTLLGAGTASKTLVACEWAAAITTGTPWREHHVIPDGGDVCILTWEDETNDYHAKLHSLLNYARPELLPYADNIRKRLHIIPMHGSAHRLVGVDERGRPAPTILPHRVVELIKADFPATVHVFIETVSRANAADESNEALAMVVAAGEIIAHQLDIGVTAVHHVSKVAAANGTIDAFAGRGGSALADNSRASTVVTLVTGEMPAVLWPAGFGKTDFESREIVLIENARSSYARKSPRLHLERVYPESGAPYLRAVRTRAAPDAAKRDLDAEKLLLWLKDKRRSGEGLARGAIVKRHEEFGLTERAACNALDRMVENGVVTETIVKQHGEKGKEVTRYRVKVGAFDK